MKWVQVDHTPSSAEQGIMEPEIWLMSLSTFPLQWLCLETNLVFHSAPPKDEALFRAEAIRDKNHLAANWCLIITFTDSDNNNTH